jgi:hypothetical protein
VLSRCLRLLADRLAPQAREVVIVYGALDLDPPRLRKLPWPRLDKPQESN